MCSKQSNTSCNSNPEETNYVSKNPTNTPNIKSTNSGNNYNSNNNKNSNMMMITGELRCPLFYK